MDRAASSTQEPAGERPATGAVQALPSGRLLDSLILLSRLSLGWYVLNAGLEKVIVEFDSGLGNVPVGRYVSASERLPARASGGALGLCLAVDGDDLRVASCHWVVQPNDGSGHSVAPDEHRHGYADRRRHIPASLPHGVRPDGAAAVPDRARTVQS